MNFCFRTDVDPARGNIGGSASFFFGGEGADEVIFATRAGADAGVLDARVVVVADDARFFAGGPGISPRRCAGQSMCAAKRPPSGTNVTGTVQLRSPLENREKVVPPSAGEGFESSRWA